MTFGNQIRAARKAAGLKQAELAARCGLAQTAISSYERDVQTPRLNVIEQLSVALHIPALDLLRAIVNG